MKDLPLAKVYQLLEPGPVVPVSYTHLVPVERIPYFGEQVTAFLAGTEQLVLVGSTPPVSFFAYPNKPSWCVPEGCELIYLAQPHEDGAGALRGLADALGAPQQISARVALQLPGLPTGLLNSLSVAQTIAQLTPDHAIYADESNTASLPLLMMLARARPHTHLPLAGGSIGQGLPLDVYKRQVLTNSSTASWSQSQSPPETVSLK